MDVQNSAGLGSATATVVNAGAAVQVDGSGLTIAETITLNGTGIGNAGALRNLANNNTWSGAICWAQRDAHHSGRRDVDADRRCLLDTGRALTIGGAGNTTVSTAATVGQRSRHEGWLGTLTMAFANTYTGLTTVSAGIVVVKDSAGLGDD